MNVSEWNSYSGTLSLHGSDEKNVHVYFWLCVYTEFWVLVFLCNMLWGFSCCVSTVHGVSTSLSQQCTEGEDDRNTEHINTAELRKMRSSDRESNLLERRTRGRGRLNNRESEREIEETAERNKWRKNSERERVSHKAEMRGSPSLRAYAMTLHTNGRGRGIDPHVAGLPTLPSFSFTQIEFTYCSFVQTVNNTN